MKIIFIIIKAKPANQIRERIKDARKIQEERFADTKSTHCNAMMTTQQQKNFANWTVKAKAF